MYPRSWERGCWSWERRKDGDGGSIIHANKCANLAGEVQHQFRQGGGASLLRIDRSCWRNYPARNVRGFGIAGRASKHCETIFAWEREIGAEKSQLLLFRRNRFIELQAPNFRGWTLRRKSCCRRREVKRTECYSQSGLAATYRGCRTFVVGVCVLLWNMSWSVSWLER